MLRATIRFSAYEDNYAEGEDTRCVNSWEGTVEASTADELKQLIVASTYQDEWNLANFDDEQIHEYSDMTEYHTSYLAPEDNVGDASKSQMDEWKQGKLRLWAIHCDILVSEITRTKVVL